MLANPNLTQEQRSEVAGAIQLAQSAGDLAQEQARGVVDIVSTVMPQLLPQMLEAIFPGAMARAQEQADRESAKNAWETVAQGSKLPGYGTEPMRNLVRETEKQLGLPEGGFAGMKFYGAQGQELNRQQTAEMIYRMVARVASGQKVSPQVIQKAVETGKRQAQETQQRRAQGKAMGSGTSSRGFTVDKTGDPMRDELRSVIEEDEALSSPFSHSRWKSE
jgi:hypothetical protein